MSTMCADDLVAFLKRGTDADCHRLLADIGMDDAIDIAVEVVLRGTLFEPANGLHQTQHFALLLGTGLHRRVLFSVGERAFYDASTA